MLLPRSHAQPIEGGRVGDDGGEVVGEDRGDNDGPRWLSGATGSEGE